MLKVKIQRIYYKNDYTIGKLYVNGEYVCDTLEDKDRKGGLKVYGETAIPIGFYDLEITYSPKFAQRAWAKKYGGRIPLIKNVPGFEGVRIHVGNTAKDTLGCPLVGKNTVKGKLTSSTVCFYKLMDEYLMPAALKGELIQLQVI